MTTIIAEFTPRRKTRRHPAPRPRASRMTLERLRRLLEEKRAHRLRLLGQPPAEPEMEHVGAIVDRVLARLRSPGSRCF